MPNGETGATAQSLQQKVEERAYAIWEEEGRPHGCHLDHWVRAEAEIGASPETEPTPDTETSAPASTTRETKESGTKAEPRESRKK